MGKIIDLTRQRFGLLTVVERGETYNKNTLWTCKCDCGNFIKKTKHQLEHTKIPSCGCYYKNPKNRIKEDLTGKKFNKLLVVEYYGVTGRRRHKWKCLCECGNYSIVDATHLKEGHTKSCGCELQKIKDNIGKINYKNGLSQTRIGRIYCNMINRCKNKKIPIYKYYGKIGIKVCDEWLPKNNGFVNFCNWAFANGYSEDLTLDRIDVNGNYEPSNCRWVDIYVQANNKRDTKRYCYKGEKLTLSQISRKYNVKYFCLVSRVKRLGWDIKKAVETPIIKGRNQYSK